MARYNDHYALLRRLVCCHACGKVNRCYIDDPALQIKCGSCQSTLDVGHTTVSDTFMSGLRFDTAGFPLPPRPLTRLRRICTEILQILRDGTVSYTHLT